MKVFKLVRRLNLSGGKVFDCVLAVTAKENSVDKIYTENVEDFEFYDFLEKRFSSN
jgi:predicted nucleic acid-binding protein